MAWTQEDLTPVWKALSDSTRRRILDLLRERPRTTGDVCDAFGGLSRFAVMKHLSVLQGAALVIVEARGRERWNHLNAVPLQQIYNRWLKPYEARWADTLLSLKDRIEKGEQQTMADKTTSSVESIHIEQQVSIAAPPTRVFEALTSDVAAWWGAPYLISEQAQTLILEPQLGGRFYEVWGEGEGALWAMVTGFKRGQHLELTGPIGMGGAVQARVVFELEAQDKGTLLRLSHRAVGELTAETQEGYSRGWQDLLGMRLKAFVETGARHGLQG